MRIWKGFADDLLSGDFYKRQRQFQESLNSIAELQKKSETIQVNSFKQHDERIMSTQELISTLAQNVFNAINELTKALIEISGQKDH